MDTLDCVNRGLPNTERSSYYRLQQYTESILWGTIFGFIAKAADVETAMSEVRIDIRPHIYAPELLVIVIPSGLADNWGLWEKQ